MRKCDCDSCGCNGPTNTSPAYDDLFDYFGTPEAASAPHPFSPLTANKYQYTQPVAAPDATLNVIELADGNFTLSMGAASFELNRSEIAELGIMLIRASA